MDVTKSDDLWTPYKELCSIVETHLSRPSGGPHTILEASLRKHKQNFVSLLKNPARSTKRRDEIMRGVTDGISLPGLGHTVLSRELVDEAIILSDMYDLNEFLALELLCTAQHQMPYHPGLPRGLVAILLYYDGRKSLVSALKTLVQSRRGVSWCTDCDSELINLVTVYTDQLAASGLLSRIIELLSSMDITKEIELLQQNRGLGPAKHHRQVIDLFEETRTNLAGILYSWAAQTGLPKEPTLKLINHLRQVKMDADSRGGIDDVTLTLEMALLYALDLSVLQKREDGEEMVQQLPIIAEKDFVQTVLEALANSQWENEGMRSLTLFTFGLALATLRLAPQPMHPPGLQDQDDLLVYTAIDMKVFDFVHYTFLENKLIYKEEFYYRRMHTLITDFIELKHSKVMELRAKADETARTIDMYTQEGLEPPTNLTNDFELLLLTVAKLYGNNDLKLNLCVEFWGPQETTPNYNLRTNTRSVSLFKFIRLAGDLVPNNLLQSYLQMLSSLSSAPAAARHAFNLLKSNAPGSTTVSWDHFFNSLNRYYNNLRQKQAPQSDTIYHARSLSYGIRPTEMAALEAVLEVVQTVATYDEVARIALCEHPTWTPLQVLLGLVTCSVPIPFKATLLRTLACLAKSPQTAIHLWGYLETSQILATVPTTSSYQPRGVQTELEEIESRNEEYPLTRAILELLDVLTTAGIPSTLGAGPRVPGFDPYLTFIVQSVFLRFNTRQYKNLDEKWMVAQKCVAILEKFLNQYEPQADDFPISGKQVLQNPPPGFHIMIQLNTKSEFLRLVLFILNESCVLFDTHNPFPGKEFLEKTTLSCLSILDRGLNLQQKYFGLLSATGCSILLTGLNKLLLGVNARSGKPDHMLNISKFVTYNSWLPKHALCAVKIIISVTSLPSANAQLMGIFTQTPSIRNEIRHGFVECLESEEMDVEEDFAEDGVLHNTKEAILKLLQQCLNQASPNITHYLFGFDIYKDIKKTSFQQAGVLGFPRTCLHSLITLLDSGINKEEPCPHHPKLLETAYQMLYLLCANSRTSEPVLRFLRSCNDFLPRHIAALPFSKNKTAVVLNKMSWLMKTAAIELKITARNHQSSQFNNISKLLLGVNQEKSADAPATSMELSHYYSINTTLPQKTSDTHLLTDLLNYLDFNIEQLHSPRWEYFDIGLMENLFKSCETSTYGGHKLINVKQLHHILMDELQTIQGTTAAGQRQSIIQEIQQVLRFALQFNDHRNLCASTVHYMDAWRQVAEVLFCVAPPEAMNNGMRQTLLLEIIQSLLKKSVSNVLLPELSNLASGCVLLLLINLRHSYIFKQKQKMLKLLDFDSSVNSEVMIQSNTLSLKFILQNIVQWMIVSGVSLQKLRINLYGAFLNFMQLINIQQSGTKPDAEALVSDTLFVSRLDSSRIRPVVSEETNQKRMAVEVITGFGDKLIDVICHDCTSGHDVCRMLALSCLDMLIELDAHTPWVTFLSRRGYLKHLIDSLLQSDRELAQMLEAVPTTLKPLYVYESKMAMLGRIASTHVGAEMLLEQNALTCLASMRVYDLHPDPQSNYREDTAFIPPIAHRFQQILFPALGICDAIMTTLGTENHSAIVHIMQFILSHFDTVEVILRSGTPFLDLGFLKELACLTGVIARSANPDLSGSLSSAGHQDNSSHLYRLQKLMLTLLPRFVLSDDLNRNARVHGKTRLLFNEIQDVTEDNKTQRILNFLDVSSNLVLYARNIIANHGADHRTMGVLFQPTLSDTVTAQIDRSSGYGNAEQGLGVIVKQLIHCVHYYQKEKITLGFLTRQLSAVPEMSTAELAEFLPDPSDFVAINQGRDKALQTVGTRLAAKQKELTHVTYLIENCLYLIWSHLDYYMLRAIPINKTMPFGDKSRGDLTMAAATEATWKVSTNDISALKQGLVTVFNETFSKDLMATTQDLSASDRDFVEALLRRIKRLIQFVPVK